MSAPPEVEDLRASVTTLTAEAVELRRRVRELEGQAADRNAAIAERDAQIAAKDAIIVERDRTICDQARALERVTSELRWHGLDDEALKIAEGYAWYEKTRRHHHSWPIYRRLLAPLVRRLGQLACLRLDAEAWSDHRCARLEEKVGRWSDRKPTETQLDHELGAAKSMMNWLVRGGKLPRNPLAATEKVGVPRRRETRLSRADVDRILTYADTLALDGHGHRDDRRPLLFRAFYLALYRTGCRFEEIHSLSRAWFVDDDTVDIPRRVTKAKRKREPRIVTFEPETLAALRAIPQLGEDPRVFTVSRKKNGIALVTDETLRDWWRKVCAKAGVAAKAALGEKVVPHNLRHAFASDAEDAGAHPREIQHGMDHASLTTTELYLHRRPAQRARLLAETMGRRPAQRSPTEKSKIEQPAHESS